MVKKSFGLTWDIDLEWHTFERYFFDGMAIGAQVGRSGLRAGVGRSRSRVRRHAPVFLPPSANAIQPDALFQHTHSDTFLEAAGLTSFPPAFIDLTIVRGRARVFDIS